MKIADDKSRPVERRGRKAMDLNLANAVPAQAGRQYWRLYPACSAGHDSQAAEMLKHTQRVCPQAVEAKAFSGNWVYTATTQVASGSDIFIEAEGFDRAGNRTVSSANPIVGM